MNLIQVLKNSKMEKKKYQMYIKQKNNLNLNDKLFEIYTRNILSDIYELEKYNLYPFFRVEFSTKKKFKFYKNLLL